MWELWLMLFCYDCCRHLSVACISGNSSQSVALQMWIHSNQQFIAIWISTVHIVCVDGRNVYFIYLVCSRVWRQRPKQTHGKFSRFTVINDTNPFGLCLVVPLCTAYFVPFKYTFISILVVSVSLFTCSAMYLSIRKFRLLKSSLNFWWHFLNGIVLFMWIALFGNHQTIMFQSHCKINNDAAAWLPACTYVEYTVASMCNKIHFMCTLWHGDRTSTHTHGHHTHRVCAHTPYFGSVLNSIGTREVQHNTTSKAKQSTWSIRPANLCWHKNKTKSQYTPIPELATGCVWMRVW